MNHISVLIVSLTLLSMTDLKADEATIQRFRKEYPEAAHRMLKRYDNLKGTYSIQILKSNNSTAEFAFLNGKEFLKRVEKLKPQGGKTQSIEEIDLLFPAEYYQFTKRSDQNRFLMSERGTSSREGLRFENRYGVAQMVQLGIRPAFLMHMLESPGFELIEANVEDIKTRHIRITMKTGEKEPKSLTRYILDPSNEWAVISEENMAGATNATQSVLKVEYGIKQDGFAFPKTARLTVKSNPEEIYEYGKWSTGETSQALFLLANYVIPESDSSTRTKTDATQYNLVPAPGGSSLATYLITAPLILLFFVGIHRIFHTTRQ
jgi:hypothetical protein